MDLSPKIYKGRIFQCQLRDFDILEVTINQDESFEIEDARELFETAGVIGEGKKFKNLIIVGDRTIPSAEARSFSTSKEVSEYRIADAFVVNSLAQKIIGNFMVIVQNLHTPTKLFSDKASALKWLKSL
jgi:hypothetical protein